MARQREPLPLPHGLTRFLPTNSGAKEKQVELAQIRDFCAQAGTFTGSHKEDIREYLHGVDKAARENGLSSFRTAKVLILQLLYGIQFSLEDPASNPHVFESLFSPRLDSLWKSILKKVKTM